MRVTYDRSVDAAYIYLQDIARAGVARTERTAIDGLNLDFDTAGVLIGIEAIPASALLPAALLAADAPQRYGVPDDENPEWTEEDFRNARPFAEMFPDLARAEVDRRQAQIEAMQVEIEQRIAKNAAFRARVDAEFARLKAKG